MTTLTLATNPRLTRGIQMPVFATADAGSVQQIAMKPKMVVAPFMANQKSDMLNEYGIDQTSTETVTN